METIVVPIDDSLDPHLALRTAFTLAERLACAVSLVSSCPPDQADEVSRSLRGAAARFSEVAPFSTRILEDPPADSVLESAPVGQGMICMPTHARAGLSRLLFGSVAEEVIRRSPQPILCVGPDVVDIALPNERIEAVICTDDSAATDAVLDGAAMFAQLVEASCVVAQVVGPDEDITTDGGPSPRPLRDRAEHHCNQVADRLESRGIPTTAHVLHGHASSSIVHYAASRAATFVVVGSTGRTGLARHTLGSVAADVVRQARCPVLVVPTSPRGE